MPRRGHDESNFSEPVKLFVEKPATVSKASYRRRRPMTKTSRKTSPELEETTTAVVRNLLKSLVWNICNAASIQGSTYLLLYMFYVSSVDDDNVDTHKDISIFWCGNGQRKAVLICPKDWKLVSQCVSALRSCRVTITTLLTSMICCLSGWKRMLYLCLWFVVFISHSQSTSLIVKWLYSLTSIRSILDRNLLYSILT